MSGRTAEAPQGALIRLAVSRDAEAVERWADALAEAGIEAHVRIEDGTHLGPGGSAYPAGPSFIYPLLVPIEAREAAATVLVDLGPEGPFARRPAMTPGITLQGAVAALLVGLAVIVIALWRGL